MTLVRQYKRCVLILFVMVFSTIFLNTPFAYGQKGRPVSKNVTISATIGKVIEVVIYGYSSPYALIQLNAANQLYNTTSNETGYFSFNKTHVSNEAKEICLVATDTNNIISQPTCIPFSRGTNTNIGPIIMPPTISSEKSGYTIGEKLVISGQTLPNSDVRLYFSARSQSILDYLRFSPKAYAVSLPYFETTSTQTGQYSLSISTQNPQNTRIFSGVLYKDNPSPKSTTLSLKIYPWWIIIIRSFNNLLNIFKDEILFVIFLCEIVIILFFIFRSLLKPLYNKKNYRSIVVRPKTTISKRPPHDLLAQ